MKEREGGHKYNSVQFFLTGMICYTFVELVEALSVLVLK